MEADSRLPVIGYVTISAHPGVGLLKLQTTKPPNTACSANGACCILNADFLDHIGIAGDSISADALKEMVFAIITKCEGIGISVHAIVSDMGPCNQALWKKCGISACRDGQAVVSCPHPCAGDTDRKLFFVADAPHILKNIRAHLVRGQSIRLPRDVAEKHNLPTAEVSICYVKKLAEIDAALSLNLCPHLKPHFLDNRHYDKMNVSSAVGVLNRAVSAGIRLLVEMGKLTRDALATAWFIEQVHRWFSIMTARSFSTAMSHAKEDKHEAAVEFLKSFASLFRGISIYGPNQREAFKPVQAGVLVATTAAVEIQEQLLTSHGFRFVLLSRLSQDALENLFSTVRLKNPVPRPLEFKATLRLITLSQFFCPSSRSGYTVDDSSDLLDFIQYREEDNNSTNIDVDLEPLDLTLSAGELNGLERQSLTYLAGYVTRAMRRHKLCDKCTNFLEESRVTEHDRLLALKSYRQPGEPNPLITPSSHVVQLLQHADKVFNSRKEDVLKVSMKTMRDVVLETSRPLQFPLCHGLPTKLVDFYLMLKLRIHLRKLNVSARAKSQPSGKTASKSVGMRVLANSVR